MPRGRLCPPRGLGCYYLWQEKVKREGKRHIVPLKLSVPGWEAMSFSSLKIGCESENPLIEHIVLFSFSPDMWRLQRWQRGNSFGWYSLGKSKPYHSWKLHGCSATCLTETRGFVSIFHFLTEAKHQAKHHGHALSQHYKGELFGLS